MDAIRIALVGLGKIARDQHLPAIAADDRFILTATADPKEPALRDVPHARTFAELLESGSSLDAVVLCTPPQVRCELASLALKHDLHVFLEKPPGRTVDEVERLHEEAGQCRRSLFVSWHSRYAPAVEPARVWLADHGRKLQRVTITWHEDVRQWHPGQAWIWEQGGFGVFDPGINALSIATRILPRPLHLRDARLAFPANRAAPIAAQLTLEDAMGLEIDVDLDWQKAGPPRWDIVVETDAGPLTLSRGGSALSLPSQSERSFDEREYRQLYSRFEALIRSGACDVDITPLQIVCDALQNGHRRLVEPFVE